MQPMNAIIATAIAHPAFVTMPTFRRTRKRLWPSAAHLRAVFLHPNSGALWTSRPEGIGGVRGSPGQSGRTARLITFATRRLKTTFP